MTAPYRVIAEPTLYGSIWCEDKLVLYRVRLALAFKVCELMNGAYMRGRNDAATVGTE